MPLSPGFGVPAVSVIVPTRNCLKWLPQALASIGADPRVEILVFDDGSDDGTAAWLAEAARGDGRIVMLRGDGVGPSRARNRAIAAARAPLLAFLDADDRWYPDKLAIQLALHTAHPEIGLSFTDYRHVTDDGEDRGGCFAYWRHFRAFVHGRTAPFTLGADAFALLYAENVVGTSTVMARTDLVRRIGGFSEVLPSSEDWDLWLRLAQRADVGCVPLVLADYLMHRPGNLSCKARMRMESLRMIGARHRPAARRASGRALRRFRVRVMDAEAEIAQATGEAWPEAGFRLVSFVNGPSRRSLREAVAALYRAALKRPAVAQPAGYNDLTAATPAARP